MPMVMVRVPPSESLADRLAHVEELRAQHRAIELRLAELERHLSLTTEEQHERARLKKLKLATKDEITRLDRDGRQATRPS